jgi:nicotinamide mononucleotide adenylyltransferase
MKFTSFKFWLNENAKDGVTVLLPGGFKPMHIGHVDLVRRYANHPDVKEVKVLIGPGVRNGITQKESLEVAKELLKDFDNVSVEAVKYPSPVLTAYKYMETAEPGTYAMAGVKKGKDDEDYKRVLKFVKDFQPEGKYYHTLPKGVNVVELLVNTDPIYYKGRTDENEGKPISASTLRRDIINDDYNNFMTNYPGYDHDTIQKIWDTTQMVITE